MNIIILQNWSYYIWYVHIQAFLLTYEKIQHNQFCKKKNGHLIRPEIWEILLWSAKNNLKWTKITFHYFALKMLNYQGSQLNWTTSHKGFKRGYVILFIIFILFSRMTNTLKLISMTGNNHREILVIGLVYGHEQMILGPNN